MAKQTYIITVDDEHRRDLGTVSQRLRAAGLDVHSELQSLGAITGAIEPEKADALAQVEGVQHVSRSGQVRAR